MKYKYMHTIEGQPGCFDGEQICFATQAKRGAVTLADSLKQIYAEQKATSKYRTKNGFNVLLEKYGWVKVKV